MTTPTPTSNEWATALGFAAFFLACAGVLITGIIKTGKWPWE